MQHDNNANFSYLCVFKTVLKMMCFKTGFSIKKVIVLSFLFLAKTIMLAHAIIPHHHHQGLIYTTIIAHHEDECNSQNNRHQCDDTPSAGSCYYPFCNSEFENCELATIYVKFCKCRQSFLSHNCDFDLFSFVLFLFPADTAPPVTDDVGLPFRQNPYIPSFSTEYISQSLGLRAPPVC